MRALMWGMLGGAGLVAGAVAYLRYVWFFRDPVRIPPADEDLIVAPADGQVLYVRRFENGQVHSEKLGRPIPLTEITKDDQLGSLSGWLIGIYMSPLDVHYNYAPDGGRVERIVYTPARVNWPMVDLWEYIRLTYLRRLVDLFGKRYYLENERNTIVLRTPRALLAVVEIADKFVNKISCFVREGQDLRRGEKLSFIARGSQTDLLIFRDDVEILVRVGQQVYGGLTPVARLR